MKVEDIGKMRKYSKKVANLDSSPSGNNTMADVKAELHNLKTCLFGVQCEFIKLDDNFVKEEEVNNYGDPVESDRHA